MGREIRRVPPDWRHPKVMRWEHREGRRVASFEPLLDSTLEEAQAKWDAERAEFTRTDYTYEEWAGKRPTELYDEPGEVYDGTRQPYRSRSWTPEEATHFQVYETVSEGTPVSPVLDSLEAVVEWAVSEGYSRDAAVGFANSGWAPSMLLSGGVLRQNIEAMGGAS